MRIKSRKCCSITRRVSLAIPGYSPSDAWVLAQGLNSTTVRPRAQRSTRPRGRIRTCTDVPNGPPPSLVAPSRPVVTEDSDDPTADNYVASWHSDQRYIPADVRFVVAWWLDEPERVGQSFIVDDARVLGRSRSSSSALLAFHRPFSAGRRGNPSRSGRSRRNKVYVTPHWTKPLRGSWAIC
jgi:hypothetical protein